jgi:hypothetical protein
VEYWTSRSIETFFLNCGFVFITLPITQLTEKRIPTDFIFLAGGITKLFGLQFKALYQSKSGDYWKLKFQQHSDLANFPWIYYGLSDLTSATQYRNSLYYLRIQSPNFEFVPELTNKHLATIPKYMRWAPFYEAIFKCRCGLRVTAPSDLQNALWPYGDTAVPREIGEIASDIILANFESRRALHFAALPRLTQDEDGW